MNHKINISKQTIITTGSSDQLVDLLLEGESVVNIDDISNNIIISTKTNGSIVKTDITNGLLNGYTTPNTLDVNYGTPTTASYAPPTNKAYALILVRNSPEDAYDMKWAPIKSFDVNNVRADYNNPYPPHGL